MIRPPPSSTLLPDTTLFQSIAVDVACGRDREAAKVVGRHAIQPEAGRAVERRQVEGRGPSTGLAEHHIAGAGTATTHIGEHRTNARVIIAIAGVSSRRRNVV